MDSPLAQVIDGYATLASELVDRWEDHASKVAARLDAGGYRADDAVADLAKTASLAAESGLLLVSEALDAATILAAGDLKPHIVRSDPFFTSTPGASVGAVGALTNGFGHTLDIAAFEPKQLAAGATEFRFNVDATGRRAGTYVGTVEAAAASATESVPVWVTVP